MSLEEKIDALTKEMQLLRAAIEGKGGVGGGAAGGKVPNKPAAKKYTAEEVTAAAVAVKEGISAEAAKFLIKKHGATELKKLKPEVYAAFVADCESAVENGAVEGMDADDGSGGL